MYGWLDFTSIANLFMRTDKLEQTLTWKVLRSTKRKKEKKSIKFLLSSCGKTNV